MARLSFSAHRPYPVAFVIPCKEGYAVLNSVFERICIEWRLDMALQVLRRHRFNRVYAVGDASSNNDTPQVFVAFSLPQRRAFLRVTQKTRNHRQST